MKINFFKYQGTGNDFILLDNRKNEWSGLNRSMIAKLCDRRFGIGGDGLILLNAHPKYDFEMKNYNSDGGECSMCGNGARCLAQLAHDLQVPSRVKDHYHFLAIDGEHEASIHGNLIHLKMQNVDEINETPEGFVLNTGSPHLVCPATHLMTQDIVTQGRTLRNSPMFMPGGINVNFVQAYGKKIFVRTYERGVEDETLSCGTGIIAAAITAAQNQGPGVHEYEVHSRGGILQVRFEQSESDLQTQKWENIWLIGPAVLSFKGTALLTEE